MQELVSKSILEHAQSLRAKEYSAVELTQAYLTSIAQKEESIGAFLTITEESALAQAAVVDRKIADGESERLPLLAGIPMALKDNMCTKGIRTSCASKMLEKYIPPYNATVVEKLEKQHYVMLGKVNMDEFAMGSSTENSAFKITHNPRNTACVPGGSSGGSAAAVAADEAAYTLGSDTGGSIRQPAAFCGVVGMKPTYGTVSRYGLVAFASSLDQIGPLTKTVSDNALVLQAIAGYDPHEATSIQRDTLDYQAQIGQGVKGLKIGIPDEFFGEGINEEVRNAVLAAAQTFQSMGAELVKVSMPSIPNALAAYYVISSAEASSNLARFDGVRYGYRTSDSYADITELYEKSRSEGFGKEVKRRIMLGTFALSSGYYDAYYKKALEVRALVRADFDRVFGLCDLILSPVAPTVAYPIGSKTSNPLEMYMGDAYSVPINIAGVPALSMPCGKDASGMPIGMQLIGQVFAEPTLYRAGYAFEQVMKGV